MKNNIISLKEHLLDKISSLQKEIDCRFKELDSKLQIRFDLQQQAVNKAEEKMNERLTGMNEFRESLKDQASKFITREEVELKLAAENKGRKDNISIFISIIAILLSVIVVIIQLSNILVK